MKILLVKPKPTLKTILRLHPLIMLEPLELGYVAAAVPPGHEVRLLDLRLSWRPERAFARELKRARPDLVGISGYTHEATRVKAMARTVRRILPGALIVVGGHHATVLPQDYNLDCFDAIVRGEGCEPFRAIVEAAAQGRGFLGLPNVMIPGPGFDESEAQRMPLYPDLAGLPQPRRDLWDARHYRCIWPSERHPAWQTIFPPVALVRSSFGCKMECSFCVVPHLSGRRHLTRPPEKVAEEIASLAQNHVYFCDDETFLDPDHARRLAEAIEAREIQKRYFAWARSTTVNRWPELFSQWRRIGLDAVFLGFEAIDDADLAGIAKHSSVADNEKAHATLRRMGIAVQAGFMVNADFTKQDFARLREYIQQMPPAQVTLTVYTPSPASPAWYEERGRYICDPIALHDCMHPLTPTALPLKEFYREFSALVSAGSARNPLRQPGTRFPFREIIRVVHAAGSYSRALRRAHRDFRL